MKIFQIFCLLEVQCKLSCRFFFLWINEKKNEMWTSLTLEIYFSVWKAVLSFEESCYYKCKMNTLPLHFFLNIAVSTKIWQSRCRTGPQPAWHRELRSFASNESGFVLLWWGSRQGCAHPHCLSPPWWHLPSVGGFQYIFISPRFAFSPRNRKENSSFQQ